VPKYISYLCLWGQPSLTFKGHEYHAPFECNETFEDIDDEDLKVMLLSLCHLRWYRTASDTQRISTNSHQPLIFKQYLWRKAFSKELFVMGCGYLPCTNYSGVARNLSQQPARRCCQYGRDLHLIRDVVVDGDLVTARRSLPSVCQEDY